MLNSSVFDMTLLYIQLGSNRNTKIFEISIEQIKNKTYVFPNTTQHILKCGPSQAASIVHGDKGKFTGRKMQLFQDSWRIFSYCEAHHHQLSKQFLRECTIGSEVRRGNFSASQINVSNSQYIDRCYGHTS